MLGKKVAAGILSFIVGLAALFLLASFAHGLAATSRPNSLGVSPVYENQYSYMMGAVLHSDEIGGRVTSVAFQPYGSSLLYTENILFCGDVTEQFEEGTMTIVTYRRQASRMYRQVACHDIYKVIALELPQE